MYSLDGRGLGLLLRLRGDRDLDLWCDRDLDLEDLEDDRARVDRFGGLADLDMDLEIEWRTGLVWGGKDGDLSCLTGDLGGGDLGLAGGGALFLGSLMSSLVSFVSFTSFLTLADFALTLASRIKNKKTWTQMANINKFKQ